MKINEFIPMTKRTGAGGSVTTVDGNEVSRSTPKIGGLQSTSYADGSVKDTLQTQTPDGTNITQTSVNGKTTNTNMQQGDMKLDTVPGANNSRIPQAKKLSYKSGITGNTVIANVPESIKEDGVITPYNTTVDVKPGETERQAKKFFGGNGKPVPMSVKGATPNQAFNLGLAESKEDKKELKGFDPRTAKAINNLMIKSSQDMTQLASIIETSDDVKGTLGKLMWGNCKACHSKFRAPH